LADNRPPHEVIPGSPVEVGTEFFALAHSLKRLVNARYRRAGLSMARVQVLHALSEHGTIRIGELSEQLDVAARTMTSTVEGLARDGLVERTPDPTDGRAVLVAMTPRGEASFAEAIGIRNEMFDEVFARLDPGERDQLAALLRRLAGVAGLPYPAAGPQPPEATARRADTAATSGSFGAAASSAHWSTSTS
jgi:DNA-binding MarR family transcriptional regulator